MASKWHPSETTGDWRHRRPVVGDIVAYDYRAWTVTHVIDSEPTPEEAERLMAYVEPYRSQRQPYSVTIQRLHGAPHPSENRNRDLGLHFTVGSYGFQTYEDGRVPLCSCHGQPWPCIERDQEQAAKAAMKRAEHELNLMPGCCPACHEPVTTRQRSITFPGPYVHNPLAEPNPKFHLRRKCYEGARRYEEAWVAADPTAPRSLLTLKCAGTVIVHADGSGECFGADGSDCPSIFARHQCMSACYLQSHGCPRECPPGRHGVTLADYPTDPRAVTYVTPPASRDEGSA